MSHIDTINSDHEEPRASESVFQKSSDPSVWKEIDMTPQPKASTSRAGEHENVQSDAFDISALDEALDNDPSIHIIPYSSRIPSNEINPQYFICKKVIRKAIDARVEIFKDDDSDEDKFFDRSRDRGYTRQRDVGELKYSYNPKEDVLKVYSVGPSQAFIDYYRNTLHTRYITTRSSIVIMQRLGPLTRGEVKSDEQLEEYDDYHSPYMGTFKRVSNMQHHFRYNLHEEFHSPEQIEEYRYVAEPGSQDTLTSSLRRFFINQRQELRNEIDNLYVVKSFFMRVARITGPGRFMFVRHPARHSPILTEEDVEIMQNVVDEIHTIEQPVDITADSIEAQPTDELSEAVDQVISMIVDEETPETPAAKQPVKRTTSTPMPPPPAQPLPQRKSRTPKYSPILTRSRSRKRDGNRAKEPTPPKRAKKVTYESDSSSSSE